MLEVRKEQLRQSTAAALERAAASKPQQQPQAAVTTLPSAGATKVPTSSHTSRPTAVKSVEMPPSASALSVPTPQPRGGVGLTHEIPGGNASMHNSVNPTADPEPQPQPQPRHLQQQHNSFQQDYSNSNARPSSSAATAAALSSSSVAAGDVASGGLGRERMQTFHTSAQEVHQRISESREEFLAKCSTIVRSLRYRGNGPRNAAGDHDAAASSDSD